MKAGFSPKLALLGIKKNARLYVPYLLSCAFMAAVLYVIAFLAATPALYVVNGKIDGAGTTTIQLVMSLGSGVISIFAALFLFYTNLLLQICQLFPQSFLLFQIFIAGQNPICIRFIEFNLLCPNHFCLLFQIINIYTLQGYGFFLLHSLIHNFQCCKYRFYSAGNS